MEQLKTDYKDGDILKAKDINSTNSQINNLNNAVGQNQEDISNLQEHTNNLNSAVGKNQKDISNLQEQIEWIDFDKNN